MAKAIKLVNINDSIKCIELAIQMNQNGELRIFNQISETLSVNQIAAKIVDCCKTIEYQPKHQQNKTESENEDHYYNPKYQALKDLGFKPSRLMRRL